MIYNAKEATDMKIPRRFKYRVRILSISELRIMRHILLHDMVQNEKDEELKYRFMAVCCELFNRTGNHIYENKLVRY